jgi:hypothetical protein
MQLSCCPHSEAPRPHVHVNVCLRQAAIRSEQRTIKGNTTKNRPSPMPVGLRREVTQIQNGARCLVFVKLELGTKMKHIPAISEFSFVLYFNIHYTPKYKHATPHANGSPVASLHFNAIRHWASIIWIWASQADDLVTLTLNFRTQLQASRHSKTLHVMFHFFCESPATWSGHFSL